MGRCSHTQTTQLHTHTCKQTNTHETEAWEYTPTHLDAHPVSKLLKHQCEWLIAKICPQHELSSLFDVRLIAILCLPDISKRANTRVA